jgi:hypothetical protein
MQFAPPPPVTSLLLGPNILIRSLVSEDSLLFPLR